MEFFGVGPLEVLLILLVGLMAFGPDRLPGLARSLSSGLRRLRKATQELTAEVNEELKGLDEETDGQPDSAGTVHDHQEHDSSGRGARQ